MVAAGLAIWIFLASIVTAILYVWDKRAAITDRPRIAEKTLLLWSVLGGWPGALIAGKQIRHKTQKKSYRARFACCVVLNITMVAFILYQTSLRA